MNPYSPIIPFVAVSAVIFVGAVSAVIFVGYNNEYSSLWPIAIFSSGFLPLSASTYSFCLPCPL